MGFFSFLGLKHNKIGLALGSGGVKGFSHIGVLKVLKENNIPISYMAGTSAGALVGGLYLTLDQDPEKLEKLANEISTTDAIKMLADLTLNGGLLKGVRIEEYLNKLLNNVNIEDLPIPFVIVATNFKTGKPKYIKRGNLAQAIRASGSVPLFFKPAKIRNNYYIDGGTTVPVPIQPLKKMGANKVIASCLDWDLLPKEIEDSKGMIKVNAIERTIALMVRDISHIACAEADVTLRMNFKTLFDPGNLTNFTKRKEFVTIGEIETLKHIEQIKSLV